TLARDIKSLMSNGYAIRNIQPFDMFPQTGHVETVVLMSRVK
ncbi:MAG: 23S rRNA (uracil(1939)-C(5))-methyltransferase RlmD, partial [Candidatus Paceibacterota bacterium]